MDETILIVSFEAGALAAPFLSYGQGAVPTGTGRLPVARPEHAPEFLDAVGW